MPPTGPRVAIHQPAYAPYGGFFAKVAASDMLVVLDTVLYSRSGFQSRNRIRMAHGIQWLTVPVHARGRPTLSELEIDQERNWAAVHWRTLQGVYGNKQVRALEWLPDLKGLRFTDVAIASLERLLDVLGLSRIQVVRASEIGSQLGSDEPPDDRLIRLLREVGASAYVAGPGGREYMDRATWQRAAIPVQFCRWTPTPYAQPPHADFVPNLSVIDMIGRVGPERTADMVCGGSTLEDWE
jgi:hypothetical protein